MRNTVANFNEQLTTPYTLEKLIDHLDTLQNAPFQHFLKAQLKDLQRLHVNDKLLAYRIDLIRKELTRPAILEGNYTKNINKKILWRKSPEYQYNQLSTNTGNKAKILSLVNSFDNRRDCRNGHIYTVYCINH